MDVSAAYPMADGGPTVGGSINSDVSWTGGGTDHGETLDTRSINPSSWIAAFRRIDTQIVTLNSNQSFNEVLELTCSTDGSNTRTHSTSLYNGQPIPSWMTFDSSTGNITGIALETFVNINYSFYVDSTSTNPSTTTQKLIRVEVIKSKATTSIKESTKAEIISIQFLMGI